MSSKMPIIGKPERYEFVRGTSLENALYLLKENHIKKGDKKYGSPDEFYLCARYDFPRTHNFSKGFQAKSEKDIINVTNDFARMHAFQDYLNNEFERIIGKVDYEEFDGANHFYNTYKEELIKQSITKQRIIEKFFQANMLNGVNIYFNEELMNHEIHPDPEEYYYTESNSIYVKSKKPISIDTVVAIQPLGVKDMKELKQYALENMQ